MSRIARSVHNQVEPQQRLTELLMAISLAADLGTGQPMGHTLRTCYFSVAIARELGCTPDETRTVLQVALLRFLGCTSDAAEVATMAGGNERAFFAAMSTALMGANRESMTTFIRTVGAGHPPLTRARLIARGLSDPDGPRRTIATHCEVATLLARRLGLAEPVVEALGHGYERWDGKGYPAGLREDVIPLAVRIAIVAGDADLFIRLGNDPLEMLRDRSGHAYDPSVVAAFERVRAEATTAYDSADGWVAVLGCEPEPHATVKTSGMEHVLNVMADFVDLKSPWTRGHSRRVAELADGAALQLGLDVNVRRSLRRAGLVHDIGRVGVENGIWDKPGPLTTEEWERVRLHPYLTQRVLTRCRSLAPLAELAACHHERLDGSGYHRGCGAEQLSLPARVLAAADVFAAVTADRPYRPAMNLPAAAALLQQEADAGRLDMTAVAAVLSVAGIDQSPPRRSWPAGLTDREMEVLQLIAQGRTNRQVADQLSISPKTVGRHVENIYTKAGVSTRAGAAVFAMEHRLLG